MSRITMYRYPLALLLLVVTFAGLGVGIWSANLKRRQTNLENARLRHEIAELRRETGYLEVADSRKLYAVVLPCLDDLTWRWRVYVPADHFALYWGFDGIGGAGIDAQHTKLGASLPQGIQVLTCAIRRDIDDPQQDWQLICQSTSGHATTKVSLPKGCRPWFTEQQSAGFAVSGVGVESKAGSPAEPLVLLRQRRVDFGEKVHRVKQEDGNKRREGVLLWIASDRND